MTSRFTVRRLAALVLSVVTSSAFFFWAVIVLIVLSSDDASDDNPEAFLPEVPAASPTEPAPTATTPIAPTREPTVRPTSPAAETLSAALEAIRSQTGAPAVAAAIFSSDGTIIDAAVGVRRTGDSTPITVDDRFQLGSETKAMTAALVGRLEEQGAPVDLDRTLAEAFPAVSSIDEAYAAVTLAQLLSHTGGIADEVELVSDDSALSLTVVEQRALVARLLLELPPPIEPGSSSHYSNLGYVVAGAALEAATGTAWEELMRAELFEPLGLESCGFGEPGADGSEASWGHDASGTAIDPTQPNNDHEPDIRHVCDDQGREHEVHDRRGRLAQHEQPLVVEPVREQTRGHAEDDGGECLSEADYPKPERGAVQNRDDDPAGAENSELQAKDANERGKPEPPVARVRERAPARPLPVDADRRLPGLVRHRLACVVADGLTRKEICRATSMRGCGPPQVWILARGVATRSPDFREAESFTG